MAGDRDWSGTFTRSESRFLAIFFESRLFKSFDCILGSDRPPLYEAGCHPGDRRLRRDAARIRERERLSYPSWILSGMHYFDANHPPTHEIWQRWLSNANSEQARQQLLIEARSIGRDPRWVALARLAEDAGQGSRLGLGGPSDGCVILKCHVPINELFPS